MVDLNDYLFSVYQETRSDLQMSGAAANGFLSSDALKTLEFKRKLFVCESEMKISRTERGVKGVGDALMS